MFDQERPLSQRPRDSPGLVSEQIGPLGVVLRKLDRAAVDLRLPDRDRSALRSSTPVVAACRPDSLRRFRG
jgi:hypothetical protein